MRINKYIASCGVSSRRGADALIADGRVTLNGKVVTDFGVNVVDGDEVTVDAKVITPRRETVTIAIYKPRGVTTTLSDPHADKTITDILPHSLPRVNPVGRLDKDSEGLLILTNDGDLHNELMHPSFEHEKEYEIVFSAPLTLQQKKQLEEGVRLEEGVAKAVRIQQTGKRSCTMVLTQGWKRQIRRMVEGVGNRVTMLKRIRIGKLSVDGIEPGHIRTIERSDIL